MGKRRSEEQDVPGVAVMNNFFKSHKFKPVGQGHQVTLEEVLKRHKLLELTKAEIEPAPPKRKRSSRTATRVAKPVATDIPRQVGTRSKDRKLYLAKENETPKSIGSRFGLVPSVLIGLNLRELPTLRLNSKLKQRTLIRLVPDKTFAAEEFAACERKLEQGNLERMRRVEEDQRCASDLRVVLKPLSLAIARRASSQAARIIKQKLANTSVNANQERTSVLVPVPIRAVSQDQKRRGRIKIRIKSSASHVKRPKLPSSPTIDATKQPVSEESTSQDEDLPQNAHVRSSTPPPPPSSGPTRIRESASKRSENVRRRSMMENSNENQRKPIKRLRVQVQPLTFDFTADSKFDPDAVPSSNRSVGSVASTYLSSSESQSSGEGPSPETERSTGKGHAQDVPTNASAESAQDKETASKWHSNFGVAQYSRDTESQEGDGNESTASSMLIKIKVPVGANRSPSNTQVSDFGIKFSTLDDGAERTRHYRQHVIKRGFTYRCTHTRLDFTFDIDEMTSGISYVTPTIMSQEASIVSEPLPPLIMRHDTSHYNKLRELDTARLDRMFHSVIEMEEVAVTSLACDSGERSIKSYLLDMSRQDNKLHHDGAQDDPPSEGLHWRRGPCVNRLLDAKVTTLRGIAGIRPLAHQTQLFLCLHYTFSQQCETDDDNDDEDEGDNEGYEPDAANSNIERPSSLQRDQRGSNVLGHGCRVTEREGVSPCSPDTDNTKSSVQTDTNSTDESLELGQYTRHANTEHSTPSVTRHASNPFEQNDDTEVLGWEDAEPTSRQNETERNDLADKSQTKQHVQQRYETLNAREEPSHAQPLKNQNTPLPVCTVKEKDSRRTVSQGYAAEQCDELGGTKLNKGYPTPIRYRELPPAKSWYLDPVTLEGGKVGEMTSISEETLSLLRQSDVQIGIMIRKGKAGTQGKALFSRMMDLNERGARQSGTATVNDKDEKENENTSENESDDENEDDKVDLDGASDGQSVQNSGIKRVHVSDTKTFDFNKWTLGVRLELYVKHTLWQQLSASTRQELGALIHITEDHLGRLFKSWNRKAFETDLPLRDHIRQKNPFYLSTTRDCFSHSIVGVDHHTKKRLVYEGGPTLAALASKGMPEADRGRRIDWYFSGADSLPPSYDTRVFPLDREVGLYPLGVHTYQNVFDFNQLAEIERKVDEMYLTSIRFPNHLEPPTCQHSYRGGNTVRTKMFLNARYLWTKDQNLSAGAAIARGIRTDVSRAPRWMVEQVARPFENLGIIARDFVNSFACNIYHDGSEGLGQHYDDDDRFKHPVASLRLFSDSRLSFGCKLYGYSNGTVTVPMPKGSVLVLQEGGWASSKIKHCIRPCDMSGKSGVLLLRHIHQNLIKRADKLQMDELAMYFEAAHLKTDGTPWAYTSKLVASRMLAAQEEHIDAEVRKVMRSLISRVERPAAYAPSDALVRLANEVLPDGASENRELLFVMEKLLRVTEKRLDPTKATIHRLVIHPNLQQIASKVLPGGMLENREVVAVMEKLLRRTERSFAPPRHGHDRITIGHDLVTTANRVLPGGVIENRSVVAAMERLLRGTERNLHHMNRSLMGRTVVHPDLAQIAENVLPGGVHENRFVVVEMERLLRSTVRRVVNDSYAERHRLLRAELFRDIEHSRFLALENRGRHRECKAVLEQIIRGVMSNERERRRDLKIRESVSVALRWTVDTVCGAQGDERIALREFDLRQDMLIGRECKLTLTRITKQIIRNAEEEHKAMVTSWYLNTFMQRMRQNMFPLLPFQQ